MNQESVDANTLRGWLERGQRVTVVDVRRAHEHAEWSIPGSVGYDAYDRLKAGDERAMEDLAIPEDELVVTVCNAGNASAVAAERLRERGIEALTLGGGMKAWSAAWNTAEVELPGADVSVVQVRRTGKGCLSYLIGSGGEAAVVDASVDPEVYLCLAEERDLTITWVLDTHVHADHLSRTRMLAEFTGATLHMPAGSPVSYPFDPLPDGEDVRIGASRLRTLGTPGHTRESASYLLDGKALFTGDALFLSAVGRPDLGTDPEGSREKARSLHTSLGRILSLEHETLVLPGHTDEPIPFDGVPIAATLGEVRESVPLLDEEAFVERIAGRGRGTPGNHERIVEINKTGEWPEEDPTELEAGPNRCAAG